VASHPLAGRRLSYCRGSRRTGSPAVGREQEPAARPLVAFGPHRKRRSTSAEEGCRHRRLDRPREVLGGLRREEHERHADQEAVSGPTIGDLMPFRNGL
jgi:hypothetical protein